MHPAFSDNRDSCSFSFFDLDGTVSQGQEPTIQLDRRSTENNLFRLCLQGARNDLLGFALSGPTTLSPSLDDFGDHRRELRLVFRSLCPVCSGLILESYIRHFDNPLSRVTLPSLT